ncbi:MAG TPA: hypothetical protein VIR81_06055 [Myxococcales bacterium]|nr:hypothetical protein [Myxococcales bacterium]
MKRALLLALLAGGCAHAIKDVSDCDHVTGEKRLECSACTVQNKAQGWIGEYEYRPDAPDGQRCVRVK